MNSSPTDLLTLAERIAVHEGVTHWAISYRILGRGDFFQGLKIGRDCRFSTYRRVIQRLAELWPEDLEWPEDIPRPDVPEDAA